MRFLDDFVVAMEYSLEIKSLFDSRHPMGQRICKHLRINNEYSLSVQASELHYCTPRALVPLDQYTHFEMAIIFKDSLISDMSIIKDFARYNELMEYNQGTVFGEVPRDLIEDLYKHLKRRF